MEVTAKITWREIDLATNNARYVFRSGEVTGKTWEATAEKACYFIERHSEAKAMREIRVRFECDFE